MEKIIKKYNSVIATVCCILTGAVLCVLWGVIYALGYVSVFIGIIVAIGVGIVYDKLGGNQKFKYLIISLTVVIEVIATMIVTMLIIIADANHVTIGIVIRELPMLLGDKEFAMPILTDILLSLVFAGIGIVIFVFDDKRKIKRLQDIEKAKLAEQVAATQDTNVETSNVEVLSPKIEETPKQDTTDDTQTK